MAMTDISQQPSYSHLFGKLLNRRCIINNKRRATLGKVLNYLERASEIVSDVQDEEEESMDNMPENLQNSYRYEKMEEAVDFLSDIVTSIDNAADQLREII